MREQLLRGHDPLSEWFSFDDSGMCYWRDECVAIVKEDPPFWLVFPAAHLNPNWTTVAHTREAALVYALCIAEDSEFGSWH